MITETDAAELDTLKLKTAQRTAYAALRRQGIDHDQAVHLVTDDDDRPVRENNGWYAGVEAARRAVDHSDYSGLLLGYVGNQQHQNAFHAAVTAFFTARGDTAQ